MARIYIKTVTNCFECPNFRWPIPISREYIYCSITGKSVTRYRNKVRKDCPLTDADTFKEQGINGLSI